METIYNFCENCENVMYVYLDKDTEIPFENYIYIVKHVNNKTELK